MENSETQYKQIEFLFSRENIGHCYGIMELLVLTSFFYQGLQSIGQSPNEYYSWIIGICCILSENF